MSYGCHIYAKSYNIAQSTMCTYPQSDHALTKWKYVLWCCADCTCINILYQETDNHNSDTTLPIRFHIYHIISRCTSHGRITFKDKNNCYMCKQ